MPTPASDNEFPKLLLVEGAAPATPASGRIKLYAKSDGLLYWKDDAGAEYAAGGDISAHLADTTDAHDASAVSIVDTGAYFTGTDVEAALQELGAGAGGAADDDTIPSGGTLYDGTSTSGWTAFGSGGLTTFDADTTVPGALYLAKTSTGGNNDYGIYRAVGGSFPRTYTCRVKAADVYGNYHGFGLMIGDSTPTAHMTFGTTRDSAQAFGLLIQRYLWTSPTSSGANAVYGANSTVGVRPQLPLWLRVIVNSSTDLDLQVSLDGYIYYELATAYNPGFTVATFGAFIFGFGATMRAAFDWIHES